MSRNTEATDDVNTWSGGHINYKEGFFTQLQTDELAHTTAHRPAAQAETLINHYNDVWSDLIAPGNPPNVKLTETILANWKAN
jgi:hypothetical protein